MRTNHRIFSYPWLFAALVASYNFLIFLNQDCAAWSDDPALNTPICTAFCNQFYPKIIGDGSGGAIIAWQDYR